MRATVLEDAALVKLARRFVWLEVDTERPENAAFLEKYPVEVWPTFLVVDPATEKAALKWLGSATAAQLSKLLVDAERAVRGAAGETAEALLARADRSYGEGKVEEAIAAWRRALERGGAGWPRRPRVVESLTLGLQAAGRREECSATAQAEGPHLPRGPSFANVVSTGLGCALSAEGAAWGAPAVAALEPLAREALRLRGLLSDDRAGIYQALVEARDAAKDQAGKKKLAEEWWAFLEAEGKRAKTREARAALDSLRVECAQQLGDPARALPALEASERDLPHDYNPPARLAILHRDLGQHDQALAAADRALARVYGPRKLRVLDLRAGILEARGDRAGARSALEQALAFAAALPQAQRPEEAVQRLQAKLARME